MRSNTKPSTTSFRTRLPNHWPLPYLGFDQLLVLTPTHALGITGTYLGDYFGILMDHRVEGFPFNIVRLAPRLDWSCSGLVYIFYTVALTYEGPFTDMIYSNRAAKSQ
ncbi:Phosphatidyl-N-methylethanolamine N-methyltransferase [Tulasnella sp. 424]|nr:Phosphatidyl-N-methylethanolamine N-methyltransferase [Tulasnella sp. 424]